MKARQLQTDHQNPMYLVLESPQLPRVNAQEQQKKERDVEIWQAILMADVIYTNNSKRNEQEYFICNR